MATSPALVHRSAAIPPPATISAMITLAVSATAISTRVRGTATVGWLRHDLLLFGRIVLSWFPPPERPAMQSLQRFLFSAT